MIKVNSSEKRREIVDFWSLPIGQNLIATRGDAEVKGGVDGWVGLERYSRMG